MRSWMRRVLVVCLALGVIAELGCGEAAPPSKLTGGLLAHSDLNKCGNAADNPAHCSGDSESVVAVDTHRSRFLVVWRHYERSVDGDITKHEVVGQFVSSSGYPGRRVALTERKPRLVSDRRGISAAYVPDRDEYVISWDGLDHRRTAGSLSAVGRARHGSFHEDNITRARDPNVRIIDQSLGQGEDRVELYGQEARLPPNGPRLRVWDGAEGINAQIVRQPPR